MKYIPALFLAGDIAAHPHVSAKIRKSLRRITKICLTPACRLKNGLLL